jgi:hypothetical protein
MPDDLARTREPPNRFLANAAPEADTFTGYVYESWIVLKRRLWRLCPCSRR